MVMSWEGHYILRSVKGKIEVKEYMEAGRGRKCESWFEMGRCSVPIKVECWH